jgi:hypothetical protein
MPGKPVLLLFLSTSLFAAPILRLTNSSAILAQTYPGVPPSRATIDAYNAGDGVLSLSVSVPSSVTWLKAAVGTTGDRTFGTPPARCVPLRLTFATGKVVRGGLRRNPATGHFVQTVTLTNTGASRLQGPLSLVLDNLVQGLSVFAPAGTTACLAPLSSYLAANSGAGLAAGQLVTVAVELVNSSNLNMTYNTRVLSGSVR